MAKYKIDNDKTGTREAAEPRMLTEEQRHDRYSVESAMEHYKNDVYYRQREGGDGWFHGRISQQYRNNYDNIKWR